jgi:hypothetical protein
VPPPPPPLLLLLLRLRLRVRYVQNDSLATLLARLEGILGPLPSWMVAQGRYSNRYYTRSRQLYERSKVSARYD